MRLEGRTVLITGGGSGIGLAFATALMQQGNQVIAVGRSEAKLEEAKRRLPGLHTLVCDVMDPASIRALTATLERDFPKLDVLVNNAGLYKNWDLSKDEVDPTEELATNLVGPIQLVNALLPQLRRNPNPTIINITTGLVHAPVPSAPVYCATKAALHSYTTSLRQQLARVGVEVIEIQPPSVATEAAGTNTYKPISPEACAQEMMKGLERGQPVLRIGQSGFVYMLSRVAPRVAENMMAKSMDA